MKRHKKHPVHNAAAKRMVSPIVGQNGETTTAFAHPPANRHSEFSFSRRDRNWLLVLLLITAMGIRICGSCNDLWLDEIWSLNLVGNISSPLQVFTKIHHSNNHYLNSLWLYLCGSHGNWPGYRIPSILAGVGSVIMAGMIGRRRGACVACFAMLLMAFSYAQILYSSEARGYAEVVFFSLLSFYALEKYLEKQEWRSAVLFSISSIFGFASQLIFLIFFCAAILWSGWRLVKSGTGLTHAIKAMLACHAAPAMFVMTLYFVDIRHQAFGGGTKNGPGVYVDSFAWALGTLPDRASVVSIALLAIAVFMAGIWILRRENSGSAIFFAGVILVVPVLLAIVRHSDMLYVRYFIIGMAFFLMLFSFVLAALYQTGLRGRIICVLLMAGYLAVNGWDTINLFKNGRGHSREAIRFIAETSKDSVVTIGSDHDFRIPLVLQFYAGEAAKNKTLEYYRVNSWPQGGPEWLICHKESFEDPIPPRTQLTDAAGNSYEFMKTFPTSPLSGLHWFIYHNRAK